jgi:RHS repeat-associated protein
MLGYGYDAAGNLVWDGFNTMTWDAENRVTSAAGVTYIYDAEGNRVEKQSSAVTDTVYFGGRPIARLSAGQWTDLIYGPTGLLAEVPGTQTGAPVYRVTDHLGSTSASFLTNGTLVNPVDYTPFGQLFSGFTSDPYRYTGLEHDSETAQEHADARQYSSTNGRWLSPDPYDGSMDLGNPQSLNRYSYVLNNPLIYIDPTGLDGCSLINNVYNNHGGYYDITIESQCIAAYGTWTDSSPTCVGGTGVYCANAPTQVIAYDTVMADALSNFLGEGAPMFRAWTAQASVKPQVTARLGTRIPASRAPWPKALQVRLLMR